VGYYRTVTLAMGKRRREDQELPPIVQKALVLRAAGSSWVDAAAAVGTSAANLREWRKHPDADGFLQEAIKSNLEQAHTLLADAAPRLAMRLVELGLDPKVKAYAQISAISEAFKVLQQGVIDKEHQDQIRTIKEMLDQLEGGTPSVIDV
jgi:hypothetical protein